MHLVVASKTVEQDVANAHELAPYCRAVEVFATEASRHDGDSPQVARHRAPSMTRRVAEILDGGDIDLVHVEGFYLMQHLPSPAPVPVLLVEQNIEYDLERQRASAADGADDPATLRAELEAWRRAGLLGVLTPEDREIALAALPEARVRLVPDGGDHLTRDAGGGLELERPRAPLVAFLANFGYAPNVDATRHLCEDILPLIRDCVPDVHLWLVGTDPPSEVCALENDRVRVTGRVPDVVPYIDAVDVMVCPLRIGGGIKVKAIEALRRGKCVVSTSVGAQGMPAEARAAIAIADDPRDFAAAVERLLSDRDLRERTERASADAACSLPTWDAAADSLAGAYAELLTARTPAVALAGASL